MITRFLAIFVLLSACQRDFYVKKVQHITVQNCPSDHCNKLSEQQCEPILDTMTFVVNNCDYETTGYDQNLQPSYIPLC